jgi:RNA-directed DNA polymerase
MATTIVDFTLVNDRADLASHLSCSPETLAVAIERPTDVFHELRIPKRNPSRRPAYRLVYEVLRDDVSDVYKTFLRRFYDFARDKDHRFPSPHAHGYLPGKSILTNAAPHIGAKRLLRADIKNFFPSITQAWVERILRSFQLTETGAREVAAFLTIGGGLPLGLPSSPLVANLACITLDEKLAKLAAESGCKYTRYADDIAISGADHLPSRIEVATVLEQEGFSLADDKFRVKKLGQAFYVTGLSISDPKRPRAAAQLKRRLRQELHFIETYGLKHHLTRRGYSSFQSGINRIDGLIRFLRGIEPDLGQRVHLRWQQALSGAGELPNYLHRPGEARRTATWLIDESVVDSPGGKTMLVALVEVADVSYVEGVLDRELEHLRRDPFYAGRARALRTKGLHYTDLPEDVRAHLAPILQFLPVRVYVAFDLDKPNEAYQPRFMRLLGGLLERRLEASDGDDVRVLVENNPQISEELLRNEIARRLATRAAKSARRPSRVDLKVATKSSTTLVALPDLFMGFLTSFLGAGPGGAAAQRFERLRDKFRVIRFVDGRIYGRRRPIERWPGAPGP